MAALNRTRGTRLASDVRVADTHWTRLRGLIGTAEPQFQMGQALWIVPCRGVHTFAMRFPLDLIYLDSGGSVIELLHNVQPWRVAPLRIRAASVLELPVGAIRASGTEAGDRVEVMSTPPGKEEAA
jgi:uncharacterized membrane protein (UPF0127 family)